MSGGPNSFSGERSPVMIDLADASLEQYDAVLDHLRSEGHYHELVGTILTVQARHVEEVRGLLRDAALPISAYRLAGGLVPASRRGTGWPRGFFDRTITTATGVELTLATMPRRLVGGVLDSVIVGWVGARVGRLLPEGTSDVVSGVLVLGVLAVSVVLVAFAGVTPAKLVLGTRVVAIDTGRPPGLVRAAVRFGVVVLPTVVAIALGGVMPSLAAAVAFIGTFAVYGMILVDSRHQGLHDRQAGTVVIRRRGAGVGA